MGEEMNEIAWQIINGLCLSICWAWFLIFIFSGLKFKQDMIAGIIGILGVLFALLIGKFFFG